MQARNVASVAVGAEELKTIREAASLTGVTISTFMGDAAVREARKTVRRLKGKCPTCGARG